MLAGTVAGSVNILSGVHNATTTGAAINMHTGSGCKGTCTIGNGSSTLNLSAGAIFLNKPITLNYNPNLIAGGGYALGSTTTPVVISPLLLAANTAKTIASWTLGTGIF
jgi:hypothetical protein